MLWASEVEQILRNLSAAVASRFGLPDEGRALARCAPRPSVSTQRDQTASGGLPPGPARSDALICDICVFFILLHNLQQLGGFGLARAPGPRPGLRCSGSSALQDLGQAREMPGGKLSRPGPQRQCQRAHHSVAGKPRLAALFPGRVQHDRGRNTEEPAPARGLLRSFSSFRVPSATCHAYDILPCGEGYLAAMPN